MFIYPEKDLQKIRKKKNGTAGQAYWFAFQSELKGDVKELSLLRLRYTIEVLRWKKNLILWVPDQFKWRMLRESYSDWSDLLGGLSIPSSTWAE